jgi:hypothetical protein
MTMRGASFFATCTWKKGFPSKTLFVIWVELDLWDCWFEPRRNSWAFYTGKLHHLLSVTTYPPPPPKKKVIKSLIKPKIVLLFLTSKGCAQMYSLTWTTYVHTLQHRQNVHSMFTFAWLRSTYNMKLMSALVFEWQNHLSSPLGWLTASQIKGASPARVLGFRNL